MTQPFVDTVDGFLTGVGRFVSGDAYAKQTTNHKGEPEPDESKHKFFMGILFQKNQDAITKWPVIGGMIMQAAGTHPQAATFAAQNWNGFHFKYEDGDDPKFADRPDFKGCWFVKFSNGFAPKCFDETNADVTNNPEVIYKGCYVRVLANAKQNKATGNQAGIFLNFSMVQRCGHGPKIVGGPDYSAILPGQTFALPPGASQIPVAPAAALPGGLPAAGVPAATGLPGGLPAGGLPTGLPAATLPAGGLPPAAGVLPGGAPTALPGAVPALPGAPTGAGIPALPGAVPAIPTAPPAPPTPQSRMVNPAMDYAAAIAQGWTEELLIAHGHMHPAGAHPYAQ